MPFVFCPEKMLIQDSMLMRFKKFGELSWKEQLLFSEAYFLQVTIGLLMKIIPFRWIPKLFSGNVQATLNIEPGTLNLIKTAIQRSSPIFSLEEQMPCSVARCPPDAEQKKNSVAAFFRSGKRQERPDDRPCLAESG